MYRANKTILFTLAAFIYLFVSRELSSQTNMAKFRASYTDSSGAKIDSLPLHEDSVFVSGGEYNFAGVDEKGRKKGLAVFDKASLNLKLSIGEEEEREVGRMAKIGYWLINTITRIATLTFINPGLGSNRTFFHNEIFKEDLKRIISLYQQEGYFDAHIVRYRADFSRDRKEMAITIFIYEGRPTVLAKDPTIMVNSSLPLIDLKGELADKQIISKLITQRSDRLVQQNIDAAKTSIQKIFNQHGYPSADVTASIDTASGEPYKATIVYQVIPGRYTVFGKTVLSGNFYRKVTANKNITDTTTHIVDDNVILRKVRYKENQTFDPDRLSLTIGQINGLGVFRSVKPLMSKSRGRVDSTLMETRERLAFLLDSVRRLANNRLASKNVDLRRWGVPVDTLGIALAVAERKERTIKPGVGFTTDFRDLPPEEKHRGLSTLPFLALQVSWQSKNFFGGARKLQITSQISKGMSPGNGLLFANYMQTKITFRQPSYKLPLIRDSDNDLLVTLAFERNNTAAFDVIKYEASPTFIRQLNREMSLNLTPLSFTKQNVRRASNTETISKFFTTNSKIGLTYNSSNDFFFPSSGFLVYVSSDFAGFLLPSDLKYLKLNWDNRRYLGLSQKLTLALRAHAGTAIPYGSKRGKEVPVSEQYYAGGPNSIRSWGIKELGIIQSVDSTSVTFLGGNSILETGLELRYNIYMSKKQNDAILGMDLAAFADVGNVWSEYNFRNKLSGLPNQPVAAVGGGMRIRTLIGPIRADFGYKLQNVKRLKIVSADGKTVQTINPAQAKKISPFAIQITLGQAF
jgi:outer membrane protein assembly factor BamA